MCPLVCRPLFEHGSQLAAVAALQGCLQQLKQNNEPGTQQAVSELEHIFEGAGAAMMPQVSICTGRRSLIVCIHFQLL